MKTAIYIENGITQLVLTPESEWEKNAIRCIETGAPAVKIIRASFYETRSGYIRQGQDNESIILTTTQRPAIDAMTDPHFDFNHAETMRP
jgi:hypothetical protein